MFIFATGILGLILLVLILGQAFGGIHKLLGGIVATILFLVGYFAMACLVLFAIQFLFGESIISAVLAFILVPFWPILLYPFYKLHKWHRSRKTVKPLDEKLMEKLDKYRSSQPSF